MELRRVIGNRRSMRFLLPHKPVEPEKIQRMLEAARIASHWGNVQSLRAVVVFRDKAYREAQYFFLTEWTGGKYFSPGMDGSRSNGLLASTWAGMVRLGREGYLRYAKAIFETAYAMQDAVRSHAELRLMGSPTFCFSFTSDEFDIYHLNDFMHGRGWRFNGQQYPNAIHMCVTRPQTLPGVVERFASDLDEAIKYALNPPIETPKSGAIYGGVPKDIPGIDDMVKDLLVNYLDNCSDVPGI